MKPKQTSTITLRGKPLSKIDKAKAYLAGLGHRSLSDVDIVHIALHMLICEPALAEAVQHITPTDGGRKSIKRRKKRKLRGNSLTTFWDKLRQTPEMPADKHQTGTEGQISKA
jgi:hypothetical protein